MSAYEMRKNQYLRYTEICLVCVTNDLGYRDRRTIIPSPDLKLSGRNLSREW
jgi:hypothetical protein